MEGTGLVSGSAFSMYNSDADYVYSSAKPLGLYPILVIGTVSTQS